MAAHRGLTKTLAYSRGAINFKERPNHREGLEGCDPLTLGTAINWMLICISRHHLCLKVKTSW